MTSVWELPDFDDHEGVHLFRDPASGLTAVIAVHSTARGPAAGGVRFWHYADSNRAITDALRLSRGMSYKNAMADLPMGGGKAASMRGRGADSMAGVHVASQGVGSVGGGLAKLLAKDGAKLTLADVNTARAQALAAEHSAVSDA